jgi:hypothetical protein
MPTFAWDQSMTTGVDSLDDRHKQLISWLNDLLSAMSQGRGRAELEGLLDQLGSHAGTHSAQVAPAAIRPSKLGEPSDSLTWLGGTEPGGVCSSR